MIINRTWAMPNSETFNISPIRDFVMRYLKDDMVSVDPFARNSMLCTYTNDLNPDTTAKYHMEAREFLKLLYKDKVRANIAILDPPYSQVQVSRAYKNIGKEYKPFGDDNNAVLYREIRDCADEILEEGGIILSFGWNSAGMGVTRGYKILEMLLVCHGGAHNDTICVAERKIAHQDVLELDSGLERRMERFK